jgi:flagellar protein FliO/FliZ
MTFSSVLQMVFALAVTLGAFGLCVVALRRYGPDLVKKLQATQGPRRLKLVESLMLDQSRRLVLVEVDGEERLILIGDARFAGAPEEERRRPSPAPRAKARKVQA